MQEIDLRDLKKSIADQIELTQEMTWDGQSTTEAKETLPTYRTPRGQGQRTGDLKLRPHARIT